MLKHLLDNSQTYLALLLFAGISTLLGSLVAWLIHRISCKYLKRKPDSIAASLIRYMKAPINLLLPLIVFQIFTSQLAYFNSDEAALFLNTLIRIFVVITLGWAAIKLINYLNSLFEKKYLTHTVFIDREKRLITKFYFLRKIFTILIVTVTAALILMNFDNAREIGRWVLTSAGLAGAIVAFAAQKSLGNIIFGLQIAFSPSLKIGDNIVVEGEFGTVEEINLTHVVIKLWDLRRLILPLSYFNEKPFQNWTHTSSDLIGAVMIYMDYSLDIEALKHELQEVLTSTPLWNKKVSALQVSDCKENCMELRILASASSAPDLWDLRCYVREKLITYIQKNHPESLPNIRANIALSRKQK